MEAGGLARGRERSAVGGPGEKGRRFGFFGGLSGSKRCLSIDGSQVPISAAFEQNPDDRKVPLLSGQEQGRGSMLVSRVDFRAVIDQKSRHFVAALGVERGGVQGRETTGTRAARIGTPGEEKRGGRELGRHCGSVQSRGAQWVDLIDGDPEIQRGLEDPKMALARGELHGGVVVGVGGLGVGSAFE
jgi:hypothetical protein